MDRHLMDAAKRLSHAGGEKTIERSDGAWPVASTGSEAAIARSEFADDVLVGCRQHLVDELEHADAAAPVQRHAGAAADRGGTAGETSAFSAASQ